MRGVFVGLGKDDLPESEAEFATQMQNRKNRRNEITQQLEE